MPTAAIWGAGSIAHTHAEALRACGIPIAAVVSRRESAAGEFAARWGITRFGTDPAILFEDGIDCIHICTPPNLHYESIHLFEIWLKTDKVHLPHFQNQKYVPKHYLLCHRKPTLTR